MKPSEIKQLIEENLPQSTAMVNSSDNVHFNAEITSKSFEGKSRVQQQQMIYAILDKHIKSGEIHAISLKTKV